jgi:thiamine transporter 2/3
MLIFLTFISVAPLNGLIETVTSNVTETESNQHTSKINGCDRLQGTEKIESRWRKAHYYLWKDFSTSYTNLYVLKWSLWWALATCGFLQVN